MQGEEVGQEEEVLTVWEVEEHLQTTGEAYQPGTEDSGQQADAQQQFHGVHLCCLS